MRTRTKNSLQSFTPSSPWSASTNFPGGPKRCEASNGTFTLGFPYFIGEYQTMTDEVIPKFNARRAKGEIFNNPMSRNKWSRAVTLSPEGHIVPYHSSFPSTSRVCDDHYRRTMSSSVTGLNLAGGAVGHLNLSEVNVNNLRDLAGTEAQAGIDSPTFAGATFIAELRETIRFLHNPIGALNKQLTDYKRSKRARKYLNEQTVKDHITNNYLSYRYAIRPLVMDIQNAAQAVARTVHGHEPLRKTSRGYARAESSANSESFYPGNLWKQKTQTKGSVEVRAGVLYEMTRDANTFGMSVPEIPGAAWEAIPFSFVVDWFFNVGSFIEAIRPVAGVNRLASWTTITTNTTTTRDIWWDNPGTTTQNGQNVDRIVTANGLSTETYVSETKTRTPGLHIGLASKVSPLGGDIGAQRILDLIAIGRQILYSK